MIYIVSMGPQSIGKFNTGIKIKLPQNTYGRIASRSGLVVRANVAVQAGVIDPDYTGTIQVILHNFGNKPYVVQKGDRIAQLILERFEAPSVIMKSKLETTNRGDRGLGSTGFGQHVSQINSMVSAMEQSDCSLQACN